MKLYRMELYKLCHRKIVIAGTFFLIVILLLFYSMRVSEESAYVDGVLYEGREAVRINRQITLAWTMKKTRRWDTARSVFA